jgi:heme A synthase
VPDQTSTAAQPAARAGVATWLGVLFCLVFTLNTVGGWVRLSGSGVAIPHWPVIDMGDHWTLLPPVTDAGWTTMHEAFRGHQERLQARVAIGELSEANLGRQPANQTEFRHMFLTEWSHRLLAALTGLVAAGVIISALRHADLRRIAGRPLVLAGCLIIAQAVLGGMLVNQGTNTHWLFLHQGNAGLIMGSILWAILRLLAPQTALQPGRIWMSRLLSVATFMVWMQLVFGALVAGSRHQVAGEVPLGPLAITSLWSSSQSLAWNLLDNGGLHLWLHRWWACSLSLVLIGIYLMALRTRVGIRQGLALQVSATFLALQVVFGLASAAVGVVPLLALGHQALGMCLLLAVILARHDARYEPLAETEPATGAGVPA